MTEPAWPEPWHITIALLRAVIDSRLIDGVPPDAEIVFLALGKAEVHRTIVFITPSRTGTIYIGVE